MTSISVKPALARRLFLTAQRLAGPRPAPDAAGLLETARDLGCVQLDPISHVDRSDRLVWFSRVGPYDRAALDQLVYADRHMFEYWAHCASYVLTDDYPLHAMHMRTWRLHGQGSYARARQWLKQNDALRRHVLRELKRHGPVPSRQLEELDDRPDRGPSRWSSGRDVPYMLFYLQMFGDIAVADRLGGQKRWDLAKRVHPEWMPRQKLSDAEVVRCAAEKSLKALGVGTARHIKFHFTRHRYPALPAALAHLEKQGRITRVAVEGVRHFGKVPAPWYIHTDHLPRLEALANGDWQPRTTLLSPFDNLICDRDRSLELFDFDFRIEIYVPAAKRQYGYYVMPIVHGDQVIGRLSPQFDRARRCLIIEAVYAQPGIRPEPATGRAIAGAIQELATFLGAAGIEYDARRIPAGWRKALTA